MKFENCSKITRKKNSYANPNIKNKSPKKTVPKIFIHDKIKSLQNEKSFQSFSNLSKDKKINKHKNNPKNFCQVYKRNKHWKINLYLYLALCLLNSINSSSITITIAGSGERNIFYGGNACSETIFSRPNSVIINENEENTNVRDKYVFTKTINYVKLIWNSITNNCNCLFKDCGSIIEVDFSDFDFSNGLYAYGMFMNCNSLTSLDWHSFGTIRMYNVISMFQSCSSLSFINLSNLDISGLYDLSRMFKGCRSLKSIDLYNFRNNNIRSIQEKFYDCPNLIYINLNNVHICNYESANKYNFLSTSRNLVICAGCYEIEDLIGFGCSREDCSSNWSLYQKKINLQNNECIDDCSSTNKNKYIYFSKCYEICPDGTYHNTNSYTCEDCHKDCKTCDRGPDNDNMNCKSCSYGKFLKYGNCVLDCINGYYEDENDSSIKICKCDLIKCFKCSTESYQLNLCISCNKDNEYYQKYEEISNNNNFIDCYHEPEGYYLGTINNEHVYKQCYESCKSCNEAGNENYHHCIECKPEYYFEIIYNNYKNCFSDCQFYHYHDKTQNKYYCTESFNCPEEYNKLIYDKNECVKSCEDDNDYKYEFKKMCYIEYPERSKKQEIDSQKNPYYCEVICSEDKPFEFLSTQECIKNCPISQIKQKLCILKYKSNNQNNEEKEKMQDIILKNFEEGFTSEDYDTTDLDEGEDEVFEIDNVKITFTTTNNQKNNIGNNITIIDLGECETLLREEYEIPDNEFLYMKKIDIYQEGMKIPKVEYNVYSKLKGTNLIKLNLTVCKKSKISLSLPYTKSESESLDKLNSSSGYYNDICYTTTSDSGTDISLTDRKKDFVNNNEMICQENCQLSEYDNANKKAKCSCDVRESPTSIIDMKINKTKLFESFVNINNIANINLMKCYKVLLSIKGIKFNIAFYIIFPIIILHIIAIFLFYCYQKNILINKIKDISYAIKNWKLIIADNKEKIRIAKVKKFNNKKTHIKNNISNTTNKKLKKKEKNKLSPLRDFDVSSKIPNKKKHNPLMKKIGKNFSKKGKSNNRFKHKKFITQNAVLNSNNKNKIKEIKEIMEFNDEELNRLSFNLAIRYDKRTYWQYYLSLIKTNHILIFSFVYNRDYNVKIIKIDLFFISFVIFYTVNALFFNDDTMHKIYEEKGNFNFVYQLPQILYSSLVSAVFNILLKLLALSESNILSFKNKKEKVNIYKRMKNLIKILNIKFIFYFIISTIFLLAFLYYLSMFGAIYKNTQIHLIKDTLISFGMSLLYPFGIYLIPGIFRIPALSKPKKKRICLYSISLLFQMI